MQQGLILRPAGNLQPANAIFCRDSQQLHTIPHGWTIFILQSTVQRNHRIRGLQLYPKNILHLLFNQRKNRSHLFFRCFAGKIICQNLIHHRGTIRALLGCQPIYFLHHRVRQYNAVGMLLHDSHPLSVIIIIAHL